MAIDFPVPPSAGFEYTDSNGVIWEATHATPDPVRWQRKGAASTVVELFTDLTDTPSSLAGEGGNLTAVNSGATALEFTDTIDGGTLNWS